MNYVDKHKELVGVLRHLDAIKAGATDEEILETIGVSVLMGGGPALMYATHAYEAMKEFREELLK